MVIRLEVSPMRTDRKRRQISQHLVGYAVIQVEKNRSDPADGTAIARQLWEDKLFRATGLGRRGVR